MKVENIHTRMYPVEKELIWSYIEKISSKEDQIWPFENWPRMILRPKLSVGASGGHGPIRYFVEAIDIGKRIVFRFTSPKGFVGTHSLEMEQVADQVKLSHKIEMEISANALLSWPLIIRPLHDALIEDAFTKLEVSLGLKKKNNLSLEPMGKFPEISFKIVSTNFR
jgi:hypothetical protein